MTQETEIDKLAEKLIATEIYCRANTTVETLQTHSLLDQDLWENTFRLDDNGEPEYIEIFEYYFVSEWLAEKLEQLKEPILRSDMLDFPVWGRTCTGQMIILDGTFQTIASNLGKVAA